MSSRTNGPYRSRLFNFVNRESRRLLVQGERTLRHLKVAAVWGAQLLLYPLYLLVQTGLSAGRQLVSEAQAGWPTLKAFTQSQPQKTPPTADTPILQVLNDIKSLQENKDWGNCLPHPLISSSAQIVVKDNEVDLLTKGRLEGLTQKPGCSDFSVLPSSHSLQDLRTRSPIPHPSNPPLGSGDVHPPNPPLPRGDVRNVGGTGFTPPRIGVSPALVEIQGVATLLATRSLVLVTVENEILDILTPQQQAQLSSRIRWEVANLLRQWRLGQKLEVRNTQRRLSSLDHPPLFLPLRLFWRVMAWVQTSPVAIAINLFGESTLLQGTTESSRPIPPFHLKLSGFVPRQLIPQKTLAFLDHRVAQWESPPLREQSDVAIILRDRTQQFLQTLKTAFITTHQNSDAPTQGSEPHRFWLQALIYAAIDYFFGQRNPHLSQTGSQEQGARLTKLPGDAPRRSGRNFTTKPPMALPEAERANGGEPDSWLTWDDLFGKPNPAGLGQTPTFSSFYPPPIEGQQSKTPAQLPQGFKIRIPRRGINSLLTGVRSRHLSARTAKALRQTLKSVTFILKDYLKPGKLALSGQEEAKAEPAKPMLLTANFRRLWKVSTRDKGSKRGKCDRPEAIPLGLRQGGELQGGINPRGSRKEPGKSQKPVNTALPASSQKNPILKPPTPKILSQKTFSSHSKLGSKNGGKNPITHSVNTDIEPAPDWIETQATPTGYVKHPLEQLLEWLDRGMLWLEELVIKLWRWIQKLSL